MPLEAAMKLIDQRDDWTNFPAINIPRHPAEKHLAGMTIVIDPGHGGDAFKPNWKRGPAGVREAEMNLRVSLLLARLLKDAGVHVILTRESDTDLDLSERAAMANSAVRARDGGVGADLFISIHHNAGGGRTTNFTSVWYHGQTDDNEPDIDVARYVAHALGRHIRTQVARTSPILSSHLMYNGGFGVLRDCQVPAILCECSFYSDPIEEQRLRDAGYNLREAYAIYEGLCEYAYCGRPTQTTPQVQVTPLGIEASSMLDEGLPNWWGSAFSRIVASTVTMTLDGKPIVSNFDHRTKRLSATLPATLDAGSHVLWIHHANMFKNHNWPQRYLLDLNKGDRETAAWIVEPLPATRPGAPTTQPATRATTRPRRRPSPASTRRAAGDLNTANPGDTITINNVDLRSLPTLKYSKQPIGDSPQLVFSDMPEYFRSGDGIALREEVKPGAVRLYIYHCPQPDAGPKTIASVIENLSDHPLTLRMLRRAFPPPGGDYYKIGKAGLVSYFNSQPSAPLTIPPRQRHILDPEMDKTQVSADQLVHALYEFNIDQPARIYVFERSPTADSKSIIDSLPLLGRIVNNKPSGAGRGVFFPSDHAISCDTYDTAAGPAQLILADGKSDPWIRGHDSVAHLSDAPNKGNYGVMYRITLTRKSSDNRSLAVLFTNPHAGQSCGGAAGAVTVSDGPSAVPRTIPLPADRTNIKVFPECALIARLPPPSLNQTSTLHLTYSPPGASCLPTPILLMPID